MTKVRTSLVLGVLITMPVLAIPWVNRQMNAWLHDERTNDHGELTATDVPEEGFEKRAHGDGTASVVQLREHQPVQDRLLQIRSQLERLGADYMLLEASPERDRHYRFHCRFQLPDSPIYTRTFEATDADPARAMANVLADVQAWRMAYRQQPLEPTDRPHRTSAPLGGQPPSSEGGKRQRPPLDFSLQAR